VGDGDPEDDNADTAGEDPRLPFVYSSRYERRPKKEQGPGPEKRNNPFKSTGRVLIRSVRYLFKPKWVNAISTVVIAVATIVNVRIAYRQWHVGDRSATAAESAASAASLSAKAAQDGVIVSERALSVTQQSVMISERPFFSIERITISPELEKGKAANVQLTGNARNTGRSQALKVMHCAHQLFTRIAVDLSSSRFRCSNGKPGAIVDFAPDEALGMPPDGRAMPLTAQDVDDVLDGRASLVYYGWVQWVDQWGNRDSKVFCWAKQGKNEIGVCAPRFIKQVDDSVPR
jgi:hypothetical protein